MFTVSPGIPGDSDSAFLDANGKALGILSTPELAPLPGSSGVGDLGLELPYLRSRTAFTAQLASGTEPFNGNPCPEKLGSQGHRRPIPARQTPARCDTVSV